MTLHHLSPVAIGMGLCLFLASCGGPDQPDGQSTGADTLTTDTTAQAGQLLARQAAGESVDAGPMSANAFGPIPLHAFRIPAMKAVAGWYRVLDALKL